MHWYAPQFAIWTLPLITVNVSRPGPGSGFLQEMNSDKRGKSILKKEPGCLRTKANARKTSLFSWTMLLSAG